MPYRLIKKEGAARRGEFQTVHGTVQTPAFQNVATAAAIKGGLSDCFIEKGRGLGNTYIGEFPSFRIDYIFHTPGIETVSYNRGEVTLSDHYPVMSKMRIKPAP